MAIYASGISALRTANQEEREGVIAMAMVIYQNKRELAETQN